MSKQNNGMGNVHQLHADKVFKIEPLEGWNVRTKYGTLCLPDGVNCVRLADVHSWMARNGRPADMVTSEMFEPLLQAACDVCSGYEEAEAIRIVSALHLVKAMGNPVPLFEPATSCRWDVDPIKCANVYTFSCRTIFPTGRKYVDENVERYVPQITLAGGIDINTLRAAFPDQANDICEDGTVAGLVYALSIGAVRVLTMGVDLQIDVVAARERKNEDAAEDHYGIKWPRHEIVSDYVNRLVVPIALAHELWGWGREVAVEVEAQAAPAKDTAPAVPKKVKVKDMSPDWTGARLAARQKELKQSNVNNFAAQTANEAKLSQREANRRINAHKAGGAMVNVAEQLGAKNKVA